MFIQGNLQDVFDALFSMGVIDPALKADWSVVEKEKKKKSFQFMEMIQVVNKCEFKFQNSSISKKHLLSKQNESTNEKVESLIEDLKVFDRESLLFLAMEVAREFVEYEERKSIH
jgi:hypothetical protein